MARNNSFVDPVYKIGQTARPPSVRLEELSNDTSVYREFELVYFVHVANRDPAEGQAHYLLRDYRVNPKKEFFEASISEIVRVLDQVANEFPIPLGKSRRAGYLEQLLKPRMPRCLRCGSKNRVPYVLVEIRIKCGSCHEWLSSSTKTPQTDARG